MGAGLGEVQPEQDAPGVRVGVRGALAVEVREEDEALAPGGRLRRGLVQETVRVFAAPQGVSSLGLAELVAEPAKRQPGGEHHSHHVPGVRQRVAE